MARALLLAIACWWTALAGAQVPVPALSGRVVDQTSTLSAKQLASLTQTLAGFEARKGTQLAVLIVPTTAPEAIEQFALRVAEQWKIGRKKVDDGAILVVAKNDRTLRIEVGYGLEGALNDATSKRIISEVIVPRFQQQDFAGGIAAGVDQIIGVVDGELLPAPQGGPERGASNVQQLAPMAIILALGLGSILRAWMGRLPGAVVTGGVVAGVTWFMAGAFSLALAAGVMALFFTLAGGMGVLAAMGMGGGGHRGSGGGGGFGGGGGGFGGGGASGRW
ncbi:TPM domain-containing protein [Aquabacterium sp.]|uniref:TPM domain-containing protein n=1 Tax=Aquabacterium sp. TaxID=1872578 RepID=UPI0019B13B30|nr:TPM domain-containing protein [Aquabacterium sp.]MBC7702195.1 TPM domain-containing protein [Aquabacterium sp.]